MSKIVTVTDDHRYLVNVREVPGVTSVLAATGLIDATRFTEFARERGSAVHRACELDDLGDLDEQSLDPRIEGFLAAWRRFRAEVRPEFMAIEEVLYCEQHDFAGRVDRVARVGADTVVIDIKTGHITPVVGIQLAAYALAYNPQQVLRRWGVRLRDDGSYQVHEFRDYQDRRVFLAALEVYKWRMKWQRSSL